MRVNDLANASWFKSTRSAGNGNCVEVAFLSGGSVAVRDSKDPAGAALVFTPAEWRAFLDGARDNEFDLPA
jgi:uncharacterized protein DUF397